MTNNNNNNSKAKYVPVKFDKRRSKGIGPKKTAEVIERLKLEQPGTKIAKELGISYSTVMTIKSRNKDIINMALDIKNNIDISNYERDITNNLKSNIINIGNYITNYNYNKASLNQLTYTFGILFDKLRLIEGKSTANIANNVMASLNPEQLDIIKESIKSLKISMLNNENN